MKHFNKFYNLIGKKNFIKAIFISFGLCFIGYFSNNWPIFSGINLNLLTKIEFVNRLLSKTKEQNTGVLFVNTSFDKTLINVYNGGYQYDDGSTNPILGKTEVTDRGKLLRFLKLLSQTDYKYLIIDIRFDENLADHDTVNHNGPQIDKELFDYIKVMPRCVVATHKGMKLLGNLECKAALADYKSTVTETNFSTYEYFDSIPSIPLHVYNELKKEKNAGQNNTIHNYDCGLFSFYFDNHWPCHNCIFLEFSSLGFPRFKEQTKVLSPSMFVHSENYKNMGYDFVNEIDKRGEEAVLNTLKACMRECGNSPYVIIGNMNEDLHDTYAGPQPGSLILYKALDALNKERHLVSFSHFIFLFVLYFLISVFCLRKISYTNIISARWKRDHYFFCFCIDSLSITSVLFFMEIIDIVYYHTTTNFIFVTLFFSLTNLYYRYKNYLNNENDN